MRKRCFTLEKSTKKARKIKTFLTFFEDLFLPISLAFLLSIAIGKQGSILQDHSTVLVDTTNIVKVKVYRILLDALFSFKIFFRCTTTVS